MKKVYMYPPSVWATEHCCFKNSGKSHGSFVNESVLSKPIQGRSQTSEKGEASLECRRREPLGGSEGMSPQENFEI